VTNHLDAPSSFLSDFEFIPCVQNGGPLLDARINSVAMWQLETIIYGFTVGKQS
jgi:hypothetical protein